MSGISELNWNCLGDNLVAFDRFETVYYLMIRGQEQLYTFSFCSLLYLQRGFQHIVLDQRLPYCKTLGLEKRVGHCAANQDLIYLTIDQGVNHWNLVGDFCAAEYSYKRMFRIGDDAAQI